jgi:hypothetical protein
MDGTNSPRPHRLRHVGVAAALLVGTLVGVSPSAASEGGPSGEGICWDAVEAALPIVVDVDGEEAHGIVALPSAPPVGLVTFAHGYGHTSASWVEHARRTADELGVIALAMDYRGTEITPRADDVPSSRGWQVAEGAADTVAAARRFEAACPGIGTIVNLGVSMGGNTSGLVAAAGALRADGTTPLFDHWIAVEPAANVIETYLEASLLAPANSTAANAKADIERQMGGTIAEVPAAYRERTVVLRAPDIAASGVQHVSVIHGLDDGLVPPNQARELVTALRVEDVPTSMFQVTLRDAQTEQDTTITGYAAGQADPAYRSAFAGHASERSTTHLVMRVAFERLGQVMTGDALLCDGEYHIADGSYSGGCNVPQPDGAVGMAVTTDAARG